MSRLLAALAASLLFAAASARAAQDDKKPADGEKKPAPAESEIDAKTRALIEREVEKAKEDIRNEVRAEIQGAQSAAEFLGTVAEGPKLEFLQLDGYYRVRGQALVNMDLTGAPDASGHYLFPVALQNPESRNTLSTANMRLRLEPTMNVSEHVRVRAQIDVLDNYVLGSSTSALFDDPGSPYPVPFYGSSRVVSSNDPRQDRPYISPKRVWAEVQTPVGLLSFGRMPSEWGLGILTTSGAGLDDDLGDTFDRIQFALPPVSTPIGRLVFVPILDYDSEGVLYADPHYGQGVGQPFDADSADDARTFGIKVARLDTDDELRRKNDRGEASVNWGLYYNYRAQKWAYPQWNGQGFGGTYAPGQQPPTTDPTSYGDTGTAVHRSAYAHITDLWLRYMGPRLRVEAEGVYVYGQIRNAATSATATPTPEILLRQWGAAVMSEYKLAPNKFMLGAEVGAASGDSAPGFGNVPSRTVATGFAGAGGPTPYGSVEGSQWRTGTDRTISNFRFNPAYRVDQVLWRHILGNVTDAFYVKPNVRWDVLPGVAILGSVIYSQALHSESTPSAVADATGNLVDKGSAPLGVEADLGLRYGSGDGFQAWGDWGILQPLSGMEAPGTKASRAHFLQVGVAAKF